MRPLCFLHTWHSHHTTRSPASMQVLIRVSGQIPAILDSYNPHAPMPPSEAFVDREVTATLGAADLPSSLEAAVCSMRPGERVSVYCAPACALGAAKALPELPKAAPHGLEWTVELMDIVQVRDMYGDGSLMKRRVRVGAGEFPVDCPINDCTVRITLSTFVIRGTERVSVGDAAQFIAFELGTGAQPPGLESSVRLMVPGETALITAAPRHAYEAQPAGAWLHPPGIPSGCSVAWEVTLIGFDAPVNWHRAEVPDILADAMRSKDAGVALFKQQHWALARTRFEAVATKLAGLRGLDGNEETECALLRVACLLNAAAAAQRLDDHAGAVAHCTTVLAKLDAGSAKAMYRRGVSHIAMGNWEQATADFEAAVTADLSCAPDCEKQLLKLRAAQRGEGAQIKGNLGGFLSRGGKMDA